MLRSVKNALNANPSPLPLYNDHVTPPSTGRIKWNPKTIMLVVWMIISAAIIYFGYSHCRSNRIQSKLDCDALECILQFQTADTGGRTRFARSRLIRSDLIRVDGYKVVDPDSVNSKKARRLAYSNNVVYDAIVEDAEKERFDRFESPLSVFGISRKTARDNQQTISDYKSKLINEVHLEEDRFFTALGVIMMFFGVLSIIIAFLLCASPDIVKRGAKKRRA